jgi:hypothetical protein
VFVRADSLGLWIAFPQYKKSPIGPIRPVDSAERVTAIQIELSGPPDPNVSPHIVEGAVSQVSLNKLAEGELTSAITARIVPSVSRASANGWRVRPEVPLLFGQVYSVISAYGEHGKFTVGQASKAYLARTWPLTS